MSTLDRLKEEIGWLKLFFAACVAIDVSVVAWLAQNHRTADAVLLLCALAVVLCVTVRIVVINLLAYKCLKQLEKL